MPRRLFVHAGPRKTATSAIQDCLSRHDNSVVIFPDVGFKGPFCHHPLVYAFKQKSRAKNAAKRRQAAASWNRMLKRIEEEAGRSDRDVVISSEVLELKHVDVGGFIRALLPLLNISPTDVEIIIACREHFSRAASWYNFSVTREYTDEKRTPDEFLAAQGADICYAPLIRHLRDSGFRLAAFNYHPSADWTARFLRHIGFPEDQIPKTAMKNMSVSTTVLIAIVSTIQAIETPELRRKYVSAFLKMAKSRSPAKFIFGQDCAREVDQRFFSEDRQYVLQELGIELTPPDIQTAENTFFISPSELEDICAVATGAGLQGEKIARIAREYVREVVLDERAEPHRVGEFDHRFSPIDAV